MIRNAWFKFNGIDSRQMGIRVTAMPPTVRAEKRVETLKISGRNGVLHIDENVFENYSRGMECAVINREKIDEIAAWLVGSGEITFSTEPDKVYRVMIANKIDISAMMRTFQKFRVEMDTYPFKYSVNAYGDLMELTAPAKIRNRGTIYSQPLITVYGSGNITLNLNGTAFPLYGVDGSISIDSEMMEVFKNKENQNSKYGGADFPRFEVGENTISWSGNVTKVVIEPRWRWL